MNSRSPAVALAPVQRLERGERHEHLAAHLEQRGDVLALPFSFCGHGRDRAQVLGDVLAGDAVAARRADREPAVLVLQRDREAVELGLGDEADRLGDQPLDARAPREQLLARERVVERQHRHAVHDRRERRRRPAARALRRRVGRDERRDARASSSRSSRTSASNSASATSGSSKTKYRSLWYSMSSRSCRDALGRPSFDGRCFEYARSATPEIYAPTASFVAAAWSCTRSPISRASSIARSAWLAP